MVIKFNVVGAGVVELVVDHVVCEEGKPLARSSTDSGMV
jgi:hypothetical protein